MPPARAQQPRRTKRHRWDLSPFYTGLKSRALEKDKRRIAKDIGAFSGAYRNKIEKLGAEKLGKAIHDYERLHMRLNKISAYTELLKGEDIANTKKTAPLEKWIGKQTARLGFFENEIISISEPEMLARMTHPLVVHYAPWLSYTRSNPYSSAAKKEQKVEAASKEYQRLFQDIRVCFDGRDLTLEEVKEALDRPLTAEKRRALRHAAGQTLKKNKGKFARLFNTVARGNIEAMHLTGNDTPEQYYHNDHRVDAEVFGTMADTVRQNYARIAHPSYAHMSERWDAGKMPGAGYCTEKFSYPNARTAVIRGLEEVSIDMALKAHVLFDENHVDVWPRRGKYNNWYTEYISPDIHPYILISYTHIAQDVLWLGHEICHGVQGMYAWPAQGYLMGDMYTPLSEVSSLFGEGLTFDALYKQETDPETRLGLLHNRLYGMCRNLAESLAAHDFESKAHKEILKKNSSVGADRLTEIWMKEQRALRGKKFKYYDDYERYQWTMVSHFFDGSFYKYSYVYGQMGANALYQQWHDAKKDPTQKEAFAKDYTDFQKLGQRANFREAMAHMGHDSTSNAFIKAALRLVYDCQKEIKKNENALRRQRPKIKA